jgi:hypothetical protein
MPKKTILIAAAVLAIAAASGCADLPRPHMPGPAMGATGTPAALGALVADDLSYGHSAGRVDTKASFIADLMDGKSDFVTLVISDQTVKVVGDAAIVRHTLTADTNDAGKPGKVAIKVLGVWQRQADGAWRLLARQAVRPPV